MPEKLGKLDVTQKSGDEQFQYDGKSLDFTLLEFWRWSTSDIVSNATRGVLAEFIVVRALGNVPSDVRSEWDAYDLETEDGIKVEVKSAAFIQSWHQKIFSRISFNVQKKLVWDEEKGYEDEARRPADVYVFALLKHKEKNSIDPLNLNQWEFFVLPTEVLNLRQRSQHSITLKSLERLSGESVNYFELKDALIKAYQKK